MGKDDQDGLIFEMDDDTSMGELMGEIDSDSAVTKTPSEDDLPIVQVEVEEGVSMADLLDASDSISEEKPKIPETTPFPDGILEEAMSTSMDDLFDNDETLLHVEGVITEVSLRGAEVDLDTGESCVVDKTEFAKWSDVRSGDRITLVKRQVDSEADHWTLLDHRPCHAPAAPSPTPRSTADVREGARFVIDGSNVCRSYMESNGSYLAPLLTLVCTILEHGGEVICVFDGNERYVLAQNARESDSQHVYDTLLEEQSRRFIEAPSTGPADDYLLKIADRERLPVISNDRFDKAADRHRQQYPWLVPGGSRLMPGRVDFFTITVPKLRLSAPLETNLDALLSRLRKHAGGQR